MKNDPDNEKGCVIYAMLGMGTGLTWIALVASMPNHFSFSFDPKPPIAVFYFNASLILAIVVELVGVYCMIRFASKSLDFVGIGLTMVAASAPFWMLAA